MIDLKELRERRVPQFTGAYLVGSWGLVQVLDMAENRMALSPHLVNLVIVGLLLLVPSVCALAWSQGRPGKDRWGRLELVTIPVNLLVTVIVLAIVFNDKELGAVTTKIEVRDENGEISQRVIPKAEFRERVLLYDLESVGADGDLDWLGALFPTLVATDLSQDLFVDASHSANMGAVILAEGHDSGRGLPASLQRKIARENHYGHYLTGSVARNGDVYVLRTRLHDAERGRSEPERELRGSDVFALIDEFSTQLREDLGVPAARVADQEDLPVAEIVTHELEAARYWNDAMEAIAFHNDFAGAVPLLSEAVKIDPSFALAQHMLYGVQVSLNNMEPAMVALEAAMEHLYRIPERMQFIIKSFYYFNIDEDADKALAVVRMWSQLYPSDDAAHKQAAFFLNLRGDWAGTIAELERVLEIDPSQHEMRLQIGQLYERLGDFEGAQDALKSYAAAYPNDPKSFASLANLYEAFGRFDEARESCESALMLDPGAVEVTLDLARLNTIAGARKEAEALCQKLLARELSPVEQAQVCDQLVDLRWIEGRLSEALDYFAQWDAAASAAYHPSEYGMRKAVKFRLHAEAGRAQEALDTIEELIATTPPPLDGMMRIGLVEPLIELGELETAAQALEEVEEIVVQLKAGIWRTALLQRQGGLELARGNPAKALESYEQGIELNPLRANFHRDAGSCMRQLGDLDGARRALDRAAELSPADPRIHLERARLFRDRGKLDEAREDLQSALDTWSAADPVYRWAGEARQLAQELQLISP